MIQPASCLPQVSCSAQQRGDPQLAKAATLEREATSTEVRFCCLCAGASFTQVARPHMSCMQQCGTWHEARVLVLCHTYACLPPDIITWTTDYRDSAPTSMVMSRPIAQCNAYFADRAAQPRCRGPGGAGGLRHGRQRPCVAAPQRDQGALSKEACLNGMCPSDMQIKPFTLSGLMEVNTAAATA